MAFPNFTGPFRKSLSDFSEIDTSDVATDLNDVPGLHQIKEIINNEEVLTNTDYMNQNLFIRKIEDQDLCFPPLISTDYLQSEIEIAFLDPLNNLNANAAIATEKSTPEVEDEKKKYKKKKNYASDGQFNEMEEDQKREKAGADGMHDLSSINSSNAKMLKD